MMRSCAICCTEKAGILDGDADTEVDLGSYAFPNLEKRYRP